MSFLTNSRFRRRLQSSNQQPRPRRNDRANAGTARRGDAGRKARRRVDGDTNSTTAAAKLHIPVAHVEAGLRSFNKRLPEEINRIVAYHLSALLLCPTQTAIDNLATEGITAGVHAVGDVMHDTTLAATDRARAKSDILKRLGLAPRTYAVCTIHRAENTNDPERFSAVAGWLERAARDTPLVMVVHPRTRKLMAATGKTLDRVRIIDPLGYLDMTALVHNASAVFTDSGGLQKEAYFHRVPCVTLRDETEWVETVDAGWNRLWTTPGYRPRREITDYGDGCAATKTARLIQTLF